MIKAKLMRLMSLYPPFIGAGIVVRHIADDFTSIDVDMKLRWWNRNYVGTHFGGSLYTMTDPFFMLMLIENLGPDYIVWDKAATVRFRRPGKGRVSASFAVSRERIDEIRRQADAESKVEPKFTVQVTDESGQVVAEVDKLLYVRRKNGASGQV